MTRNIKVYFTIFFCLSFITCKPDLNNPEVNAAYSQVMKIHDEVMPEISTIHKLMKKLRAVAGDNYNIQELSDRLELADEEMMQWMADFGKFKAMDKSSVEEKIAFLNTEKNKISRISGMIKSSISDSQAFLKNLENE